MRESPAKSSTYDALWQRLALAIGNNDAPGATTAAPTSRHARAQGDISDFEPFFRAHQHDIFTYLWRMTSDEQAAYDLTQETFLRAWRHFARFATTSAPAAGSSGSPRIWR